MEKVILVLVDGMRPDAVTTLDHPLREKLLAESLYCESTRTVMPSVTLPCHMSLFHSVPPERHGTTTNTYMPQVRPVTGLFDAAHDAGCRTAMFYSWEELRDISRPGRMDHALFISQYAHEKMGGWLTDETIDWCKKDQPDLVFLYLGEPDEVGHKYGWMTEAYMESVTRALDSTAKLIDALGEEYTVILTADHGGHDRGHGTELPEDMTIPLYIRSKACAPGEMKEANIMDIAPTVAKLLGVRVPGDWEGRNLVNG